ncbi:MAG: photosynthetic complex putative assembly protein PuhB [Pseudomonadota bacterium]
MSHDDFEIEPIPGLPANLPKGEHIVWQGKPDRGTFARVVLHERKIVLYFLLLIGWKFGTGIYDGETFAQSLYTASTLALGAFIVIGLIRLYAKAVAKTTVYTITNKRIVMRFGVALPVTFNFPFAQITEANLKQVQDDKGTISLGLKEHTKVSWLILWPHVRPWKLAHPQPSIRLVSDVQEVAILLQQNLSKFHESSNPVTRIVRVEDKPTVDAIPSVSDLGKQGA